MNRRAMRFSFMLRKIALLIVLTATASIAAVAQTSSESLQYRVQYAFGTHTALYKMVCTTEVARTYSDSTTAQFSRVVELFLSYRRTSGAGEDFAKVRTYYDSVNYEYTGGGEHYKWNSIHDDGFPTNSDYMNTIFPIVGRNYTTVLSPYFEVAKIEGAALAEAEAATKKIKDTLQRQIWTKAGSAENLLFYSDMNKGVLKSGRFAVDSTWKAKFTMPIEGIRYTCDTAAVVFYLYDGKNFNIKAQSPLMQADTGDRSCVIGEGDMMLATDSGSTSKGVWDISVSPRGMVDKVTGVFETQANYRGGGRSFKDMIKTEIKYELLRIK